MHLFFLARYFTFLIRLQYSQFLKRHHKREPEGEIISGHSVETKRELSRKKHTLGNANTSNLKILQRVKSRFIPKYQQKNARNTNNFTVGVNKEDKQVWKRRFSQLQSRENPVKPMSLIYNLPLWFISQFWIMPNVGVCVPLEVNNFLVFS